MVDIQQKHTIHSWHLCSMVIVHLVTTNQSSVDHRRVPLVWSCNLDQVKLDSKFCNYPVPQSLALYIAILGPQYRQHMWNCSLLWGPYNRVDNTTALNTLWFLCLRLALLFHRCFVNLSTKGWACHPKAGRNVINDCVYWQWAVLQRRETIIKTKDVFT